MNLKDIYLFEQVMEKKMFLHDEETDDVNLELTKNKDTKDTDEPSGIMGHSKDNPLDDDEQKSSERNSDWAEDPEEDEAHGGENETQEGPSGPAGPVGESLDLMIKRSVMKECMQMKKECDSSTIKENKDDDDMDDLKGIDEGQEMSIEEQTIQNSQSAANKGQIMAKCMSAFRTDPIARSRCVSSAGSCIPRGCR